MKSFHQIHSICSLEGLCIFTSVFRNTLLVLCSTDKQLSHKCNYNNFFVSASACWRWCCISWLCIGKDPCRLNIHLFYSGVSGICLIPTGYFQLKKYPNFQLLQFVCTAFVTDRILIQHFVQCCRVITYYFYISAQRAWFQLGFVFYSRSAKPAVLHLPGMLIA